MTPTLGRGANLAMRDGALLGRQLKLVASRRMDLFGSLAERIGLLLGRAGDPQEQTL
jgi:hypothetical protein